jgi:hypothetical protein
MMISWNCSMISNISKLWKWSDSLL